MPDQPRQFVPRLDEVMGREELRMQGYLRESRAGAIVCEALFLRSL